MNRNEYNLSVDKFSDDVFRFIYKTCHNKELAEDIIQDAYMVLWEHVREITFEKAKAFLFTTSYDKMIDIFRREKRNKDIENINPEYYFSGTQSPDLQDILEFALNKLSPVQKTVILFTEVTKRV